MSTTVVRRFDVHVAGTHTLDDATVLLRALVRQESSEMRAAQITSVPRLGLLDVRLEGSARAVSRIQGQVGARPGLRVDADVVRLKTTAPDGLPYPDPAALLAIGVAPEGPPALGPGRSPRPVTVAIVDSGIMVDHPDLKPHLWTGMVVGRPAHGARCIGPLRADVTDEDGHGTRLAGTILAAALGAPDVRLMAVKFFDADTVPGARHAADGINFAVEQGAHIINLSWILGIGSPALERAIQTACDRGALVVIAAGNAGTDNDDCAPVPACYARNNDAIITVMATDRHDRKPSFSNYGRRTVDLAAPGMDVVTTRAARAAVDGAWKRHRSYDGTSAAAAHVTGAAALLMSRDSDLAARAVKDCLSRSVDPVPGLRCATRGRLNLGTALAQG